MLAFVNDGCNPLLIMAIIIAKMFFSDGFNMPTDCWLVKVVLLSNCWFVILTFIDATYNDSRRESVKVFSDRWRVSKTVFTNPQSVANNESWYSGRLGHPARDIVLRIIRNNNL
jgi:hypothetical protein